MTGALETQVSLYNSYVVRNGQTEADTASARPGYSEHQTGFAMDIGDFDGNPACDFVPCFKDTAGAKWVALHAQDYGFVVRYQLGFDAVTGYFAEPWHLRYLGVTVAKDLTKRGFHSHEQYLGVPAAPGY
jgi:zinc D-Ala-D-Ala carboxypeptidase